MAKVVLNKSIRGLNDLSVDCCDWLIKHASESDDSSFIEFVASIAELPWDYQNARLSRYFESKREHPLLVRCIETVSSNWPFYISEYDENLFRYTIEQDEFFDSEYGDMFLGEEYLKLIPLIRESEVVELMKKQNFSGLIDYLKARDINMVIE